MFGIFGVAGVSGNYLATKAIGRFGVDRAILVALCFLIAGLGMFGVFFGNYILGCIACFIWGLGTFSSNSLQQSRLVVIAPGACRRNRGAQYFRGLSRAVRWGRHRRLCDQGQYFGKCRLDGAWLSCPGCHSIQLPQRGLRRASSQCLGTGWDNSRSAAAISAITVAKLGRLESLACQSERF